jgi:hypothetical protein
MGGGQYAEFCSLTKYTLTYCASPPGDFEHSFRYHTILSLNITVVSQKGSKSN